MAEKKNTLRLIPIIGWVIIIFFLALYIAWLFLGIKTNGWPTTSSKGTSSNWGTFGDGFGVLNCLLTLGATIALIITIYIEKQSLHIAQDDAKENERTRKEDQVERHFMSMLSQFNQVIDGMSFPVREQTLLGRTVLVHLLNENLGPIRSADVAKNLGTIEQNRKLMASYFPRLWEDNMSRVRHYFRMLYNILSYVKTNTDNGKISKEISHLYVRILRAQLSDAELTLIFYNGIYYPKMAQLIEESALFDNISITNFVSHQNSDKHFILYKKQAYGEQGQTISDLLRTSFSNIDSIWS